MEDNVDVDKLEFGKKLKGAKCLNLCELRLLLEDRLRLHPMKSGEAHNLMKSSHQYATKFGKIKNRASVMLLREALDENKELHEYEISCLVNLLPKTPDETKALIPSLARLPDDEIERILAHLESHRTYSY
ncbi:DNA-directed RNA polymerase II subunit RPB4, putative [Cryptosporidium muris RN66]|uniref:DNA-directed RNA polymerase II subunit RPB4, putative n=1 Tax=Cryptosporidium muris (strain RN66) TaxID=441375 RepID=B6AK31_CRYMR|nr:DNA-directed RNA polymerase II subunit RPB4, putative [Cryptosporidium muris RN66]EEA08572.1 DNA-directed RNA polymerase II subunit RPB4, putative [Cryptosporidium muris RN66]|eukprot:XP_002142921.1 DNA-directed RNA polymerase II subunit RPB4 [Cryptosporidium muris RN66]